MTKRLLPAYPLFVKDPYFSVWAKDDILNRENTMFWTGMDRPTYGVVWANGKLYSFLGVVEESIKLEQKSLSLTAFTTDYEFECDLFTLKLSFVSPLLPNDYKILSCPVCYLDYEVLPKSELKEFKIALIIDEKHCYNKQPNMVIGGSFDFEDYQAAYFGLNRQHPLSHSGDSMAADWGYTYLAAKEALYCSEIALKEFYSTGNLTYKHREGERKYLIALETHKDVTEIRKGKFLVAFDDLCSIFYFGEWLPGYYFKDGATIFDAIADAYHNHDRVLEKLKAFDLDLQERCKPFGEDYLLLAYAALRQTLGAHKLVENKDGELLFLSKECHSNGCIATVDVSYPSSPLFLLFNPELLKGMLLPIFKFARYPIWTFPFAPHDAGTFPYCLGQTYALVTGTADHDRDLGNSIQRDRSKGQIVSHPKFYTYPENTPLYKLDSQMPIEECGNMLIMTAAYMKRTADLSLSEANFDLLKKWCEYLVEQGLIPKKQLCTDDFVSRLDKNINLSVKAIVGIKAFALICEELKKKDLAAWAHEKAQELTDEFHQLFKNLNHIPLTYDSVTDTFSLKYNFAFDILFGTDLFDKTMMEKEVDHYIEVMEEFGVPLDSRSSISKSDWQLFVCTLTKDPKKKQKIYSAVAKYLRESPSRVPFSDLYFADSGVHRDFQNRTVQGGIFILLLEKEGLRGD